MIFDYAGDDGARIKSWFTRTMRGIAVSLQNNLPEDALALIYSAIDSFGLLGAPPGVNYATRSTFIDWVDKYVLPHVVAIEGQALTAVDLYAARCGVLHSSTPVSEMGDKGKAREIWYRFGGLTGIRMIGAFAQLPLTVDVEALASALKRGGLQFCMDINADPVRYQLADSRAQHFLRWGKVPVPEAQIA